MAEAVAMTRCAREEGFLNIAISAVEQRMLPPTPNGIPCQNRLHEFIPGRPERRLCESCGKLFDDGPHEP